jgi:hypothetical protein
MAEMSLVRDADISALWKADLRAVGCLTCGVAHLTPPDWRATLLLCPACLAETLEPQPARLRPEPPEKVVPFSAALTPAHLSSALGAWLRGVWLRPADLRVERLLARLARVYVPMWLVDGRVTGHWQAQMGFDYQVESTQERFKEDKGWTVRHLTETQVRWEPRVGRLERTYHDLVVPALEKREEAALMARLGDYEWEPASAYTPAHVANAAVRVPSLLPEEAWPLARAALDQAAAADCQRATGAQHNDEFELEAEYDELNWTQLLLPCYVTYYEDDAGRRVPVWVNGQSGQIGGQRRASSRKAWFVTGGLGVFAVLNLVAGALLALLDVSALAALLMTVGFFLLFTAALPVLWAWQFNQRG